jgi:hypothetical protein
MALRLKYHPACKREVDRLAALARQTGSTRRDSTRTCDHCGTEFQAKRSNARYCSTRCRVAAHREIHRA